MQTVSKPIFLDETCKEIVEAIKEQTNAIGNGFSSVLQDSTAQEVVGAIREQTDAIVDAINKKSLGSYLTKEEAEKEYLQKGEEVESAQKAISDGEGNVIAETYAEKQYTYTKAEVDKKLLEVSGGGEVNLDGYLQKQEASETYLSKQEASSTYLRKDESEAFLTKEEAQNNYLEKSAVNGYLTKEEAEKEYLQKGEEVESAQKAISDGEGNVIAETYAEKSETLSGYGITDAYTKTEVEALIANGNNGGSIAGGWDGYLSECIFASYELTPIESESTRLNYYWIDLTPRIQNGFIPRLIVVTGLKSFEMLPSEGLAGDVVHVSLTSETYQTDDLGELIFTSLLDVSTRVPSGDSDGVSVSLQGFNLQGQNAYLYFSAEYIEINNYVTVWLYR